MPGSVKGHVSLAARARMSADRTGKPFSEAHKAALSAAKKGKPRSPANVAACKAAWARKRSAGELLQ